MKKSGLISLVLVLLFILCSASFAENVPGYQKGRCRILKPGTTDRSRNYYCENSYEIIYDGYLVAADTPCKNTLEEAAKILESSSFCNSLPALGSCTLLYPGTMNASRRYCEKGTWSYTTFDGLEVEGNCYQSAADAFDKMRASPACTQANSLTVHSN